MSLAATHPATHGGERRIAPTAIVVGNSAHGLDGRLGTIAGTRERPNHSDHPGYVLVRVGRLFGMWRVTHVVPATWIVVSEQTRRTQLSATRAQVMACPRLRPDASIREDVLRKVEAASTVHWTAHVDATVTDGVVSLRGQPADSRAMKWASRAVAAISGVVDVELV